MSLKTMKIRAIEDLAESFHGSKSTAMLHLIYKGYQLDGECYQQLQQDIKLAKDLLEMIPDNFSPQRKKIAEIIISKSPSSIKWVTKILKNDPVLQKSILNYFLRQKKLESDLEKLEKLSVMNSEIWSKLRKGAELHARHSRIYFNITDVSDQEIKVTVKQKESPTGNYQGKERLIEICSEFLVPITEKTPLKITVNAIPYK